MKIAILGFGSVGQVLAKLFKKSGHDIIVGQRAGSPSLKEYPSTSLAEATKFADIVVLAIPFQACQELLSGLRNELTGKILIDNTNPLNEDWSPRLLGQENSAAEEIARMVPETKVVKAFNTIFADVMDKTEWNGNKLTAFIAGEDDSAKSTVSSLAESIGYAPLDVGSLTNARYLEGMAHLNIQIAVGQSGGTNAALIYCQ